MVAVVIGRVDVGRKHWEASRDKDGHRQYRLRLRVRTTDVDDGPQVVANAPGLPTIGSAWNFGNDLDLWAFCTPEMKITPVIRGEINRYWNVDQVFSTVQTERCQDTNIEDPLLEPDRVSGSFVKYTEEAVEDRNGVAIKSSSHEMFRGPQVEFDRNRPTVIIDQNVASLGLETFSKMVDTVNDRTLWGLAKRKIKLSNVSWARKLYGVCNFYYTRRLEFDVNFDTFDREVIDEGTKVLKPSIPGQAPPDRTNPKDFERYKDVNGENNRVLLNGLGEALGDGDNPVKIPIEKYDESNFLTLGIPTSF